MLIMTRNTTAPTYAINARFAHHVGDVLGGHQGIRHLGSIIEKKYAP